MVDYVTTNTDGIAEFRLNRPKSRNSLTFEMYQALEDLCQVPPTGTGAIVLTAEGEKAFASGTDISKFREFHSTQDAIEYEAMIGRVIQAVEQSPVPVIASLHGVVAGGAPLSLPLLTFVFQHRISVLECQWRVRLVIVCRLQTSIDWFDCLVNLVYVIYF